MNQAEKKGMLEYIKLILEKISFNQDLFRKELKKASTYLSEPEWKELIAWCDQRFTYIYN